MASIAAMGAMIRGNAQEPKTISTVGAWTLSVPTTLTVHLGDGGYKKYIFTTGSDSVTFTADELFAALKAER